MFFNFQDIIIYDSNKYNELFLAKYFIVNQLNQIFLFSEDMFLVDDFFIF